jgi:2-oxoglutarate-Fe(II)-dependent oxygenase superfamily protein
MISAATLASSAALREAFQHAKPFRHVVVEDFLEASACEALLRDFPRFEDRYARDEHGGIGRKAVVERAADVSAFYRSFCEYINSPPFLAAMSAMTGIDQLIADPTLFGGGTHENLAGQGLDVHIDFNIDERRMLHRRVNLLIYLNKEWDEAWGGAIELHSDPFNPRVDEVKSFLPLFNRAVIFETNEYSWHGFRRIVLPPDQAHVSRKSFSIYLYTKDRPADEVVAPHTTFYVPQPLPPHLRAGYTLTDDDIRELDIRMQGRDGLLRMYQKLLIEKEQRLRDFLQVAQRSPDHQAMLSSRSWKLLMALQRMKYRLTHLSS